MTKQRALLVGIGVSGTLIVISVAARWGLIGAGSWMLFVLLVVLAAKDMISRPDELRRLGKKLTWANTTIAGFAIYLATIAMLLSLAFWLR